MKTIKQLTDKELDEINFNPQYYSIHGMVLLEQIKRVVQKEKIQFQREVDELYEKII